MRFFRHLARLATIATLLGGTAVLVSVTSPAASAASTSAAATQDGWVRIAHLSPEAPAMDMYLYPFGNPRDLIVLRDVSYGDVSAYQTLSPGEYTVAMRGFGAPSSSKPALTTSFKLGWSDSAQAFVQEKTGENLDQVMGRILTEKLGKPIQV